MGSGKERGEVPAIINLNEIQRHNVFYLKLALDNGGVMVNRSLIFAFLTNRRGDAILCVAKDEKEVIRTPKHPFIKTSDLGDGRFFRVRQIDLKHEGAGKDIDFLLDDNGLVFPGESVFIGKDYQITSGGIITASEDNPKTMLLEVKCASAGGLPAVRPKIKNFDDLKAQCGELVGYNRRGKIH